MVYVMKYNTFIQVCSIMVYVMKYDTFIKGCSIWMYELRMTVLSKCVQNVYIR